MGLHEVDSREDEQRSRAFREALLDDLAALELMIERGLIESGPTRIGAEQEMLLVDDQARPAPFACEILQHLDPATFTTEIGRFNLEANLTPLPFSGDCLGELERGLDRVVSEANQAASIFGANVLLSGTLATARVKDLTLDNLTPRPRYQELNRIVMRLRGGAYHVFVRGGEELDLLHDNVMPEACCTSFQVHLQVDPKRFTEFYNAAQLAIGPVLAAASNSPLLLGRRLWHETRIALFQHAVDERSTSQVARSQPSRVTFGEHWVRDGVMELLRDQTMRFRPIFTAQPGEPSLAMVRRGEIPLLAAMRLHNGTIWRWNRPCYGVNDGVPHLRIEFRALPSGPTVLDEVANAAFLFGLVNGLVAEAGNVARRIPFEAAHDNFFAAARHGLEAQMHWFDHGVVPASSLINRVLLPLAFRGLTEAGIDRGSATRYLKIIEERVEAGLTGSNWALAALPLVDTQGSTVARDRRLVRVMLDRQQQGSPVHEWEAPRPEECACPFYETVAEIMSTDLSTVGPADPLSLAASIMEWRHVRHVPVEDESGRLVGVLSIRDIVRTAPSTAVREVMSPEVVSVSPATSTAGALRLMRERKIDCLPVVESGRLVGLVTSHDMLSILGLLLKDRPDRVARQSASAAVG